MTAQRALAADRATVASLRHRGAEALEGGDSATALRHWNRALAGLIEILATGRATADDHLGLGHLCYVIGEALIEEGDGGRATAVLNRGLLAYRTFELLTGDEGPTPDRDPRTLVADLRLQRAKAFELRGWAASALVEAQAGLTTYLDRWSGEITEPAALDVARALVWQGWTTMRVGDPDVAAAALDLCLDIHLGNALTIDEDPELSLLHGDLFRHATLMGYLVHAARDRPDRADHALTLLRGFDPKLASRAEKIDVGHLAVARAVSLDQALDAAGASATRRRLLAPVERDEVLTSTDRGDPERVVLTAMALRKALHVVLAPNPAAARRIVLEIHTLLADGAAPDWRMRLPLAAGPSLWTSTLVMGSRLAHRMDDHRLATDLHRWLAQVTLELRRWPSPDRQVTAALADARRWMESRPRSPLALA